MMLQTGSSRFGEGVFGVESAGMSTSADELGSAGASSFIIMRPVERLGADTPHQVILASLGSNASLFQQGSPRIR